MAINTGNWGLKCDRSSNSVENSESNKQPDVSQVKSIMNKKVEFNRPETIYMS